MRKYAFARARANPKARYVRRRPALARLVSRSAYVRTVPAQNKKQLRSPRKGGRRRARRGAGVSPLSGRRKQHVKNVVSAAVAKEILKNRRRRRPSVICYCCCCCYCRFVRPSDDRLVLTARRISFRSVAVFRARTLRTKEWGVRCLRRK